MQRKIEGRLGRWTGLAIVTTGPRTTPEDGVIRSYLDSWSPTS